MPLHDSFLNGENLKKEGWIKDFCWKWIDNQSTRLFIPHPIEWPGCVTAEIIHEGDKKNSDQILIFNLKPKTMFKIVFCFCFFALKLGPAQDETI